MALYDDNSNLPPTHSWAGIIGLVGTGGTGVISMEAKIIAPVKSPEHYLVEANISTIKHIRMCGLIISTNNHICYCQITYFFFASSFFTMNVDQYYDQDSKRRHSQQKDKIYLRYPYAPMPKYFEPIPTPQPQKPWLPASD